MVSRSQPLKASSLVTFAAAALPVGAFVATLTVYLPNYYASHFGLPLAAVGLAFMIVRLLDIVLDPIIGIAMDWTHTRFGKFRPWLLAAAPLLLVSVYALYLPPGDASVGYLVLWLLVLYAGYSMLTLSQAAWGAALVGEYHQRSRIYGWIQVVSVVGALGVLFTPLVLLAFDPQSPLKGVPIMGLFVLASVVITEPITIFLAPEPQHAVSAKADRIAVGDYWQMIKRPEMLRILWADLFCTLGPAITAPLYIFFFHEARGYTLPQITSLLMVYTAAGLVGPMAWSRVARLLGKHQTIRISSGVYVVAQTVLLLVPNAHIVDMTFAMFAVGFTASSFAFLIRAMVADVGDEVRLETGKDRMALLYAMTTSTGKIGSTISVGIAYAILPLFGFNAAEGARNTADALWGLQACYLVPPVACVLIGGLAMWGYKLDETRHRGVRDRLAERDALSAAESLGETLTPTTAPVAAASAD
jgi:Na+/melibiose symporter-like transporter